MDSMEILSEGNKQKVMLLKWLSKDANIFIFDEPTAGIDTTSKVDIYNLMADLLRKGASIILLTSDINELLGLSDRILVMNKGTIIKRLESKDTSIEEIYEYLVKA
jgi:ribose transport system ATP-binding protein